VWVDFGPPRERTVIAPEDWTETRNEAARGAALVLAGDYDPTKPRFLRGPAVLILFMDDASLVTTEPHVDAAAAAYGLAGADHHPEVRRWAGLDLYEGLQRAVA
jgi:hypothetical protein